MKRFSLQIHDLNLAELTPNPRNARTHGKRQIRQIADSIEAFGFTNPILIDGGGTVLAGHGRLEAARLLGLTTVPTVRLDHMNEAQKRAYVLADNKLAELAGWDRDALALELGDLVEVDAAFDVTVTGFEAAEIDMLLAPDRDTGPDPADNLPDPNTGAPPVSRPGDAWRLGRHRLLCGDATSGDAFDRLMAGEAARLVFVDPPYNVPIDGHVTGLGAVRHREFAMASGEMDEAQFSRFLERIFTLLCRHTVNGSIHYVCMDWRHARELLEAGRATYTALKNICVWRKTNAGMGSLYRSQHELVFVFKNGTGPHVNNVELGRHGRNRSNVWDYAGANSFGDGRDERLAMHPTVKPVQLVADAVLDCSGRGELVLDAFAGSGTMVIACERTGRRARAMEIDPLYCDAIIRRWQSFTGDRAMHAATGRPFDEMAERARAKSSGTSPEAPPTGETHDG